MEEGTAMRTVPRLLTGLALALALLGAAPAAQAITLDEAKARGYVGERYDGYLALVDQSAPAEVRALVEEVNAKRRARYAEIAQKRGVPVEAVGKLTAEKVINQAAPGTFVMTPKGAWQQR